MALHLPLHLPITSLPHPQFRKLNKPTLKPFLKPHIPNPLKFTTRATSSSSSSSEEEKEKEDKPTNPEEVSDIGSEIKKAMEEREKVREEGGFWDGVAKEAKEIEWPAFGKVVGTTGVVLGVIAGSSVVLLTLNAVLAELSDKVFAGRGVQDFFG